MSNQVQILCNGAIQRLIATEDRLNSMIELHLLFGECQSIQTIKGERVRIVTKTPSLYLIERVE